MTDAEDEEDEFAEHLAAAVDPVVVDEWPALSGPVTAGVHDGVAIVKPAEPFHRIEFVSMDAGGQVTIRYLGRQDGDPPFDEHDDTAQTTFIRAAIPILKAMLSAAGETLPS